MPKSTTQRGYGWSHQKARRAALAAFVVGQPCVRCGKPLTSKRDVELDHDDNDRSRYLGLAHSYCNRQAGGRKSHGSRAEEREGYCPTCDRCSRCWEHGHDPRWPNGRRPGGAS